MNDIELLEQQAIDAAINIQWKQAIELNNKIVKLDSKNEGAYLRLGFVYLQMRDIEKAKKYYSKALRLQPRNSVALQNLERVKVLENEKVQKKSEDQTVFDPGLFMDAAGKTKTVALANLGQKNVLAGLTIGQPIQLKVKKHRVEARTQSDDYIGTLPDDLSKRLIYFFKAKSTYLSYIKESTLTRVIIFIKEEKKGKSVYYQISFPQNIQKKMEDVTGLLGEEKEEDGEENQEEHVDAWEKMVSDRGNNEDKELLVDIQRDDLDDEE
jgi:tetratricopeptide (TPR) repeat protein